MITIVLGVWMVDFFMVGLNLDQLDVIGSNQRSVQRLNRCVRVCVRECAANVKRVHAAAGEASFYAPIGGGVYVLASRSQLLGTVIFNFAFVTSIPSWANEKVTRPTFTGDASFVP
jgi:hypothetical protein